MEIIRELTKEIDFVFPEKTSYNKINAGFKLTVNKGAVTIEYSSMRHIARAALIIKANGLDSDYVIEEKSDFNDICLMIDCSRNAVRNIETVKKLIRNLSMIGYTSLMLYTEDTYEIDGEPIFGYLRGRYTKDEMKELDNYANSFGIELIPCIQTLAHMNQLTRYKYSHFKCFDCADIMLVGEERTYDLIDKMFKTLSECYTTKRIHIGMDEAWLLGRGVYLNRNGLVPQFDVICSHLIRVCDIAKKYDLQPIIWSDMFWRIAYADKSCRDNNGKVIIPEKILSLIPKEVILCHWEYHILKPEGFDEKLEIHSQFKNEIWFAGGTAQCNRGFVPHLTFSTKIANAAIESAKKHNIKSLMETLWGDNGGEGSLFANLPSIMHYSYTALGLREDRLRKDFLALTGYEYDSFLKIEEAQTFGQYTEDVGNPAKYGLYNDVFLGYLDCIINSEDKKYFQMAKNNISQCRVGSYDYIFDTIYSLNDILELKYDMGIRLRKAYAEKNTSELESCSLDLLKIIDRLEIFIENYRKQWLIENKPNGLEVQEIRLGGLKERLRGCQNRLDSYLHGKIQSIPELEEVLLPQVVSRTRTGNRADIFSQQAIASVGSFDGYSEIDV